MSTYDEKATVVSIDGNSMTPELLVRLGTSKHFELRITDAAKFRVAQSRATIDRIVLSGRVVYGVSTGFGKFESTVIPPDQLDELQLNLIRSHCAGVGSRLPPHRARMLLALRINVLCKGHSGIRLGSLETLVAAFNKGIVPCIPTKGTVGASGDLAPLSHLALGLIGEGQLATLDKPQFRSAAAVLKELGITPLVLKAKEGLALINGTQFMTSLACEAVVRARNLLRVADITTAVSIEALQASVRPMDPLIHSVRPHPGQQDVAGRIRSLLHSERFPSEISLGHANCTVIQDAYSLRCSPQVHGIVADTISFVHSILSTEVNCATDNPLIFADAMPEKQVISGGNFHGEYPAKALDMLAIAVHELGNISERRIERLNNPALSKLPAFLIERGGLNSGFMIAHCTAAALVSENKVLCHPASVDSISTSAAQEDHVSMGGFAARKALKLIDNVQSVLAIELLCAMQGVDFHKNKRTTEPLERLREHVRARVTTWTSDRNVSLDIEALVEMIRSDEVWAAVSYAVPKENHFPLVGAAGAGFGRISARAKL